MVRKQIEVGIDIGNDGEQPRIGFQTYIPNRMQGFGGESQRRVPLDAQKFPDYVQLVMKRGIPKAKINNCPQCIGPLDYCHKKCQQECEIFAQCMINSPTQFVDRFVTSPSPGIVSTTMLNAFYDSHESYLFALADEMQKEYELIYSQGLILQIDAPDLLMDRTIAFQDLSLKEYYETIELHVEAINRATINIPKENIRLHTCWGNYDGPHIDDVNFSSMIDILYKVKAGALLLPFANPRHQHEYHVLRKFPLPDTMLLIPGVIDTTTCYVEHPEVVCNRICQAIETVGDKTRVIAGCDCGFGTFTGYEMVPESIVWEKLKTLKKGAELASEIFF
ncbi:MAG: epoxyalkane--coenzyme M transferase [Chlamydiales bacterium]